MDKKTAKERIQQLRREIEHHRYLYHVLDKQEISDAALDSLKNELLRLEEKYPEFIVSDSPTQRIGGKPLDKFEKVRHKIRQWSLEDSFTEEEILEWDKRIRRFILEKTSENLPAISYNCELKIDGLHMVLNYQKGILITGATRGDGQVGEDVTNNLKTIEAIPLKLKKPLDIVVEGEVFMEKNVFTGLNQKRKTLGEEPLANPRNAAAGAIRQLDPKVAEERKLDFFAYDISWPEQEIPLTQYEELKKLMVLGFKVNQQFVSLKSIQEVINLWKSWEKKKDAQDYWLDGLVLKINERKYQNILGFTGKAPRWALALKYAGEETTTVIRDIKLSLGRTGKITPVAILDPVRLVGTTVSRANLHNFDEIKRLDVRIGDTVVIYKAGDIIPQVKNVLLSLRPKNSQEFSLPNKCPVCSSKIIRPEGEVNYYCSNLRCGKLERTRLYYFVSKNGFDIEGLGPKIIDQLMDVGLIAGPVDIFRLTERDISPLERFADKSAANLIQAVNKSKKITFRRFLIALGIKHVGREGAILLEKNLTQKYGVFDSLDKIVETFAEFKIDDLETITGVGPKIAKSLVNFFQDKHNQKTILALAKEGVSITIEKREEDRQFLAGQTFVFTGTLENFTREQAQERIMNLGGNIADLITKKTTFLVAGANPGSKYEKAKEMSTKIINEDELRRMIGEKS